MKQIIRAGLLASFCVGGCSTEQATSSEFATGKPPLLRSIDNSVLSVVVRVNDDSPDYTGEQRTDGSWFVRMDLSSGQRHTFVASWYASTKGQKILLVEQRGEFYTSATSQNLAAASIDVSEGDAFNADCDDLSNLAEMQTVPPSDPLSSPGCSEPPTPVADGADPMGGPDPSVIIPDLVALTGGCFQMGSALTDPFRNDDERQHEVCVDPFHMGLYEVTFDQYNEFAGQPGTLQSTPHDRTWGMGSRPLINVTWRDAVAYTQWLSELTGDTYRLPTEAEWEYAARGNMQTLFWAGDMLRDDQEHFGSADPYGGGVATGQPSRDKTIPVGSLQPNPFGLYDMLGNVIEFTCSLYSDNYENELETRCDDDMTQEHVVRGAAYNYIATWARSSTRTGRVMPDEVNGHVGFRVVRENR